VISGLWGAADINSDQRIEYSELQSFVASANRTVDDPRAKPSVIVHPPALDPQLAMFSPDALPRPLANSSTGSVAGECIGIADSCCNLLVRDFDEQVGEKVGDWFAPLSRTALRWCR